MAPTIIGVVILLHILLIAKDTTIIHLFVVRLSWANTSISGVLELDLQVCDVHVFYNSLDIYPVGKISAQRQIQRWDSWKAADGLVVTYRVENCPGLWKGDKHILEVNFTISHPDFVC
eukprot:m.256251 g.256251  ORF g.256251 m.256251 type:complete len:118 (+) comp40400_c1_seq63:4130-4483(+)